MSWWEFRGFWGILQRSRQSQSGGANQRHRFDNDGYADGDAARIGTAEPQTAGEFGRHCSAPEGERGNQIQKPLLRRKVCGA